jgi:hypothetical protein
MVMSRKTFSKTSSYHLEWEIIGNQCHIHCTVEEWKKSVLREGYLELARLQRFVGSMGYGEMYSISPNPKFCELLGGTSLGEFKEGYEVMVWETVRT